MRTNFLAVGLIAFIAQTGLCQSNPESDLLDAANEGNTSEVLAQIKLGVDINTADHTGDTVLHAAVRSKSLETVRLVLEHGADVNALGNYGYTPLDYATNTRNPSIEIARLLLEQGADVNHGLENSRYVLRSSSLNGDVDLVDLFFEYDVKLPTDPEMVHELLRYAAHGGVTRVFDLLVEQIGELEPRIVRQLMGACGHGTSGEIVTRVIELGGDPSRVIGYGQAPIHVAAGNGHVEVVKALIDGGADINARDGRGKNAYDISRSMKRHKLKRFLRSAGADMTGPQLRLLEGPYIGQTPPGTDVENFASGIAAVVGFGDAQHSTPVFSPAGDEVYWSDANGGPIMGMRTSRGHWMSPEPVKFMTEYGDSEPAFSQDGSKLFFLSSRPLPDGSFDNQEHIWFVNRKGNGWSEPEMLGEVFNQYNTHWQICLGPNDDLYFSSETEGGVGDTDILVSRNVNGEYAEPELIRGKVNTEYEEWMPFVSPDGSYMLFSRRGDPDSVGSFDLYLSLLEENGAWGEGINLGDSVNTASGEICPIVSTDGEYLFFIHSGTFWWVSTEEVIGNRLAQADT